jgi:hypothetical protein
MWQKERLAKGTGFGLSSVALEVPALRFALRVDAERSAARRRERFGAGVAAPAVRAVRVRGALLRAQVEPGMTEHGSV